MDSTSTAIFITVQKLYYPLLCILGIPANLVTFYLILVRRCGMSDSAVVYLSCLAVVDSLYLLWVILLDLSLHFWLPQPFWHASPWCEVLTSLQHGALYSSSWVVVAFTVERYVVLSGTAAVRHPSRRRVPGVTCVAVVTLSHLASVPMAWINAPTPVNVTVDGANVTLPRCRYRDEAYSTALVWVASVLSVGVPVILLIVFNSLIGSHLSRAGRLFSREEQRVASGRTTRSLVRRSILLLGTVSVAFVALSLPRFVTYCILRTVYNSPAFDRNDYGLPINVAGDLANMLHNLNSTTNFLLYCMVSRRFRLELLKLLRCRRRPAEPSSGPTNTSLGWGRAYTLPQPRDRPPGGPWVVNQADTDPDKNQADTDPDKNQADTDPDKNQADTNPYKNQADTNPYKNQADTNPYKNQADTNPYKNQADTNPYKNQADTNPYKNQADTNPYKNQADTNPYKNQADTDPDKNQADTNPYKNQADTNPYKNQD
ncbi:unnamed protein product [Arctogadus glacialis]